MYLFDFFILPHISYYEIFLNPLLPGNIKDQGYGFTPFELYPWSFCIFNIQECRDILVTGYASYNT